MVICEAYIALILKLEHVLLQDRICGPHVKKHWLQA